MKKQSNILLPLFVFSTIPIILSWDFNKGGIDWDSSCQGGPHAPLDISKPFTYRRMII